MSDLRYLPIGTVLILRYRPVVSIPMPAICRFRYFDQPAQSVIFILRYRVRNNTTAIPHYLYQVPEAVILIPRSAAHGPGRLYPQIRIIVYCCSFRIIFSERRTVPIRLPSIFTGVIIRKHALQYPAKRVVFIPRNVPPGIPYPSLPPAHRLIPYTALYVSPCLRSILYIPFTDDHLINTGRRISVRVVCYMSLRIYHLRKPPISLIRICCVQPLLPIPFSLPGPLPSFIIFIVRMKIFNAAQVYNYPSLQRGIVICNNPSPYLVMRYRIIRSRGQRAELSRIVLPGSITSRGRRRVIRLILIHILHPRYY